MLGGELKTTWWGRERDVVLNCQSALLQLSFCCINHQKFFSLLFDRSPLSSVLFCYTAAAQVSSLCVFLCYSIWCSSFSQTVSLSFYYLVILFLLHSAAVQQFSTLIFNREKLLLRWNEYSWHLAWHMYNCICCCYRYCVAIQLRNFYIESHRLRHLYGWRKSNWIYFIKFYVKKNIKENFFLVKGGGGERPPWRRRKGGEKTRNKQQPANKDF